MASKSLNSTTSIELLAEGYLDESGNLEDEPVESALFYVDQDSGELYIRVPGEDGADDTWVSQGSLVATYADNPEDVGTTGPGTAGALAARGDHVHGHGSQGTLASAHGAAGIDVADSAGHFDATNVETAIAEAYDDFEAHAANEDAHHLKAHDHTGAEGTVSHGDLTDLGEDDHPQYLTTSEALALIAQEHFYCDSLTVNAGTIDAGDHTNLHALDNSSLEVSEVAGAPGIDIEFDFSGIDALTEWSLHGYYTGTHTLNVELWNYDTSAWDIAGVFVPSLTDYAWLSGSIPVDTNYIDGSGNARMRINHPDSGVPAHDLFLDYLTLTRAYGGAGQIDHGALADLGANDHPQYQTEAEVDTQIATHTADVDAHHAKYTDAEAQAAVDVAGPIATHASNASAHHAKYLDAEAVTAMGVKGDANPLHHDKYTDGEVDAIVATHTADVDAHHARYTDGEAVTAMGVKGDANALHHDKYTDAEAQAAVDVAGPIATHTADVGAHHPKYLDSEAVAAMGVKGDANPLHHDKYTDGEVDAIVATHTADVDAHHAKYTDGEAVTAMGVKGDANALNHDKYTDAEVDAIVTTHTSSASAHHAKYTDVEAVAAIEATANYIELTDGSSTLLHTHAGVSHPDLATHDALGLQTDSEAATHAADVDAHHAKYTDAEAQAAVDVSGPIATHAADVDAHHAKYLDSEAVAAMGVKGDANALHHDKYTDAESRTAMLAPGSTQDIGASGAKWRDGYFSDTVNTAAVNADSVLAIAFGGTTFANVYSSGIFPVDETKFLGGLTSRWAKARIIEVNAGKVTLTDDPTADDEVGDRGYNDARYADIASEHTKYTDGEAVTAMGVKGDANALHHDKYTDAEVDAIVATHTSNASAHHAKYLDSEAVTAMGAKGDANPLNHDRYTDGEVNAIVATHTADVDAHHAKYTDAEAVTAVESEATLGLTGQVTLSATTDPMWFSGTSSTTGLSFDTASKSRFTWNDGGGNFLWRNGSYYDAGNKYVAAGMGAADIYMNFDTSNGFIYLRTADAAGAAGDAITYNTTIGIANGTVDLGGATLYQPADPTGGGHVGDRDYNDARYVQPGDSMTGELGGTFSAATVDTTHSGSAHHNSHTVSDISDLPNSPAGELGGTWASPTVDTTHAGSAHHTKYTDAEAITAVEGEATLVLTGAVSGATSISTTGNITADRLMGNSATDLYVRSDTSNIYFGANGYATRYVMTDTALYPFADSAYELGTTSKRWSNIWGDAMTIGGNIAVAGTVDGVDVAALGGRVDDLETVPVITKFTSSGSWTKTTPVANGLKYIVVEVQGGGGGGGGVQATGSDEAASSGGGAGGGYARKLLSVSDLSSLTSLTVTHGPGGSGGSGTTSGFSGTASSVSGTGITTISGSGGEGGTADTASTGFGVRPGGDGGAASGGDINVPGGDGGLGRRMSVQGVSQAKADVGGSGGGSHMANERHISNLGNHGRDGQGYGGGGTGCANGASTVYRVGGDGADGIVIITEHY